MNECIGTLDNLAAIKIDQVNNAYGLYILVDDNMDRIMQDVMKSDAKHKVEVLIAYKDKKKEFTLKQFLDALGF